MSEVDWLPTITAPGSSDSFEPKAVVPLVAAKVGKVRNWIVGFPVVDVRCCRDFGHLQTAEKYKARAQPTRRLHNSSHVLDIGGYEARRWRFSPWSVCHVRRYKQGDLARDACVRPTFAV